MSRTYFLTVCLLISALSLVAIPAASASTIGGTFGFTNLLSTPKDYNLTFTLPVGSPFSPSEVNGHFTGAVDDANGSGSAFLNNIVWAGLIDGVTVMNSGPTDIGCGTAGCTITQSTTYLGTLNYLPGVSNDIATNISFTLSAGDHVTFSTYFDVAPIPEPGTLVLLAGMLALPLTWNSVKKKVLIHPTQGRLKRIV